jgi:hypothetical protein
MGSKGMSMLVVAVALLVATGLAAADPALQQAPARDLRPPLDILKPDLVITQLQVMTPASYVGYSALVVWVNVKNIGPGRSPKTTVTALVSSLDAGDSTTPGFSQEVVPPLDPGKGKWVTVPLIRTTVTIGIVAAIVDRPVGGKLWGSVLEGDLIPGQPLPRQEQNNAFAAPLVVGDGKPVVYTNYGAR